MRTLGKCAGCGQRMWTVNDVKTYCRECRDLVGNGGRLASELTNKKFKRWNDFATKEFITEHLQ